MTEILLNPDQAKRLSELIQTIPAPLPSAFKEFSDALDEASDSAEDSSDGAAYIDLTIQVEEED